MSDLFNKNFWIACIAAIVIIILWDTLFLKDAREKKLAQKEQQLQTQQNDSISQLKTNNYSLQENNSVAENNIKASSKRIKIKNALIEGSLSLNAGRIDDISLLKYKETLAKDSPDVRIFDYKNNPKAYYFESGWVANSNVATPTSYTNWVNTGKNEKLTPSTPVVLSYAKNGLVYTKTISMDDQYVITIEDEVKNNSKNDIEIAPYSLILRHSDPNVQDLFISHEGFVGYLGKTLERVDYKDTLTKQYNYDTKGGYLGFTDKYWLAALLIDKNEQVDARFLSFQDAQRVNNYQADIKGLTVKLGTGEKAKTVSRVFVGPKEYKVIKGYNKEYSLGHFEDTIDFGWFFFFTKPMISFLLWIYHSTGNFGLAILIFTIVVRIVILPIAYKSYVSMAKMKELQPKMKSLKDLYASDQPKYHKELMALYKKEKVNPLSGCLPILLQIPIFFSIYKVIFVSIELRHAPFWGWISDMSAKDPTSVLNLFGLIPVTLPDILHIGAWPILMGISMFFQQKLATSQPLDGMQQKIMNFMPVVLVFALANFPAGLVIYWTWSNILSIIQQYIINKRVHYILQKRKNKTNISKIKTK